MRIPDRSEAGIKKVIEGLNWAAFVNGSRFGPEHRAIEIIQTLEKDYWLLRELRDSLRDELFVVTENLERSQRELKQAREINERLEEELAIALAAKPASKSGSGRARL